MMVDGGFGELFRDKSAGYIVIAQRILDYRAPFMSAQDVINALQNYDSSDYLQIAKDFGVNPPTDEEIKYVQNLLRRD